MPRIKYAKKADIPPAVSPEISHLSALKLRELMTKDPIGFQKSLLTGAIQKKKEELPHLHGFPFYQWSREFFDSRAKVNLLCASNQCGKSTTFIRKNIEWAGNPKLWKELWPSEPKQFWYFYPDADTATREVETKWIREYLPRGSMKHHDTYGWEIEYDKKDVSAIHFRSGVTIYFFSYSQQIKNLQSATVHMVTGDEEMPPEFVPELMARVGAVNVFGYFNLCFTATQGFELWYRAMECIGKPEETFKKAFKKSVSLYECQFYEDGSPGPWTLERIKEREDACTSENERLKRVMGRFVKDEGIKYASFRATDHFKKLPPLPKDWKYFGGVDIGSGGKSKGGYSRSSAAIVLIAANPEFTQGRVVTSWRGDDEETNAKDILDRYVGMTRGIPIMNACYDYNSREFGIIAARTGVPFVPADKNRDSGAQVLNTMFGSGAFLIDEQGDNAKLVTELMSVPVGDKNRKFQDDLTDALRYVMLLVPWNFMAITKGKNLPGETETPIPERSDVPHVSWTTKEYEAWEIRLRRGEVDSGKEGAWQDFYDDIDDWNEAYGT